MKKNYFSIVIPTLNESKYLPKLLSDLKDQTFQDFNVIVADGNSTDETVKIAKEQKAMVLKSKETNVAYQRNQGGKKANCEYILFLDADTRLSNYFLEGVKYRLTTSPADVFTTWLAQDSSSPADMSVISMMNLILELGKLLGTPTAYGAMIGCKKDLFIDKNLFNVNLNFAEDSDFIQNLYSKGYKFKLYKDPRYIFSLRRFRKEGSLPLIQKYAKLNMMGLLRGYEKTKSKDYPMLGGSYYTNSNNNNIPKLIRILEDTLKKINPTKQKRLIQKVWENLLNLD